MLNPLVRTELISELRYSLFGICLISLEKVDMLKDLEMDDADTHLLSRSLFF
jgi:hypothetical protein